MARNKGFKRHNPDWVKVAIAKAGNVDLFPDLKIPKKTAYNWIRYGVPEIANDAFSAGNVRVNDLMRIHELEEKVARLEAIQGIRDQIDEALNRKIQWQSIKEPEIQDRVLKIISEQGSVLGIAETNAVIGLPRTRYKRWRRDRRQCPLTGKPANRCPSRYPNQLTAKEIEAMKNFMQSELETSSALAILGTNIFARIGGGVRLFVRKNHTRSELGLARLIRYGT